MSKNYFHNYKSYYKNNQKIKSLKLPIIEVKKVVDINILLNRVKIDKKNETKRKIIFFSYVTLSLGLFGTLIAILK